jgi:hypothetical protein
MKRAARSRKAGAMRRTGVAMALVLASTSSSWAQSWPSKPIGSSSQSRM